MVTLIKKITLFVTICSFLIPAGVEADGGVFPPPDYYIQETDQKAVIFYKDGKETLVLSVAFQGDAKDFGWVIPTPSRPDVVKSSDELFTAVAELTQPEYEYSGKGLGVSKFVAPATEEKQAVQVIETKKVDIYDIAVLQADDSQALAKWLSKNKYNYPKDKGYILNSYIEDKWYFTAVKVDTTALTPEVSTRLRKGHATPLKLVFDSEQIIYPLKISSIISKQKDIIPLKESKRTSTTSEIMSYPYQYESGVEIRLFVFADGKKEIPGFTIEYASKVKQKDIEKLAYENGKPWIKADKKMFVTRLYRYMTPAEMTEDLILRQANDNKPVNARGFSSEKLIQGILWFIIVFVVLLLSPLTLTFVICAIIQFLAKSKVAHMVAWIFQGIMFLLSCLILVLVAVIGITEYSFDRVIIYSALSAGGLVILLMIFIVILQIVKQKKQCTKI